MWFTEDPWPPMLLCGFGALVGVGVWSGSKRALPLGFSVACLIAAGVIYVVERIVLTPAEQVEALVVRLVDEFRRKDAAALDHFSRQAAAYRTLCQAAMEMVDVEDDLQLSDFRTRVSNNNSRAVTQFRAKGTVSVRPFMTSKTYQPSRFELTWTREGEHWRIIEVRRLHPFKDGEELGLLEHRSL
jgi:hypothetical protein